MPWKEMGVMDQRVRFAGHLVSGLFTMTELCEAYGISRQTEYTWGKRYRRQSACLSPTP